MEYALANDADDNTEVGRLFTVDSSTGWLEVRSPLDREARGQYRFHVLAFDQGSPSMTSSASVVITVQDENDEKPYFTR